MKLNWEHILESMMLGMIVLMALGVTGCFIMFLISQPIVMLSVLACCAIFAVVCWAVGRFIKSAWM